MCIERVDYFQNCHILQIFSNTLWQISYFIFLKRLVQIQTIKVSILFFRQNYVIFLTEMQTFGIRCYIIAYKEYEEFWELLKSKIEIKYRVFNEKNLHFENIDRLNTYNFCSQIFPLFLLIMEIFLVTIQSNLMSV